MHITREQAHAAIDAIFDELERLGTRDGKPADTFKLCRIALIGRAEDTVDGAVMVDRSALVGEHRGFVTWGIMREPTALHSGHYDMGATEAYKDFNSRVERGW